MPKRIVIVGDIPERPERSSVLRVLRDRAPSVDWDWIQAEGPAFNLPQKYFRPLQAILQDPNKRDSVRVIKLFQLNGRDQHQLYRDCPDPVEPPQEINTAEQLIEWLLGEDAGLVGDRPWKVCECGASLIALLSKLLKNKSFNKDTKGHMWTKEEDLLGQAPVVRPDSPYLYGRSNEVLVTPLFISKGGKQGTTPKEWCINTAFLPAVKQAITQRSLDPLRARAELRSLFATIDGDKTEALIDERIVCEKVRAVCRDTRV